MSGRLTLRELAEQVASQGRLIEALQGKQEILKAALWQHELALRELHARLGAGILATILNRSGPDSG